MTRKVKNALATVWALGSFIGLFSLSFQDEFFEGWGWWYVLLVLSFAFSLRAVSKTEDPKKYSEDNV